MRFLFIPRLVYCRSASHEKKENKMYTSRTLSSQEERGLVLFHGDSCELISISSQDYDIYFNSVQTNKQKKTWSAGETC